MYEGKNAALVRGRMKHIYKDYQEKLQAEQSMKQSKT